MARHELYCHKRQLHTLSVQRLKKHLRVLSTHHSKDQNHLAFVAQLAATMTQRVSWRCVPCWTVNSRAHDFCPKCGIEWKYVYDVNFTPPEHQPGQQEKKTYNEWDDWNAWEGPWKGSASRGHTPRQQRPNSPRHRQQKGKDKGKGKSKKGKGKGQGEQNGGKGNKPVKPPIAPALPPEPAPAWGATASTATPKETMPPRKLSVAEQRLQELTEALTENDNALSSKVQGILADHAQKSEQETAKEELDQLQGAAARVYQAKKQLSAARIARQALHHTWNTHITDSLTRWRGYASEFQEQDKTIATKIEEASAALAAAQQKLDEAKENSMDMSVEISDTEETGDKKEAATAILEGMTEMVTSFEKLQRRAEAFNVEQPPPKKHKADGSEPGKLGSGALEPFGGAR